MPRNDTYTRKPPKSLTVDEQARLLKITKDHIRGFRDHVIYSLVLGTGLREHEVEALNVGDVYDSQGKVRRRVQLRVFKRSNKDEASQQVFVPDALKYKLEGYRRWKKKNDESTEPDAPLFLSQRRADKGGNKRLTSRGLRKSFLTWMQRLGYKPDSRGRYPFGFHSLRHSCGMNLFRATKDLRVVQRQLRHSSITSTIIYAEPSDEDVMNSVRDLDC